ncbi:MAG: flavoprotein, partial [Oscillospiraceae bacterium]
MEQAVFKQIVDLVVSKLIERSKKLLVLYTGSPVGMDAAQEQLRQLRREGYTFSVYASASARNVLNMNAIYDDLGVSDRRIIDDYHGFLPLGSAMVIPTLTRNSAAKLAYGINDNPFCDIVSHGIMSGYEIIAAYDACCSKRAIDMSVQTGSANAYRAMLAANLDALAAYGIRLTASNTLAEEVKKATILRYGGGEATRSCGMTQNSSGKAVSITDRLISANSISA